MMSTSQRSWLKLVVTQVTMASAGVHSLVLADPQGVDLPHWQPGAHITLRLPGGLERQYSLCGDPHNDGSYTIAVLCQPDGRGGSSWIAMHARVGLELEVSPPSNHFELVESASYLFVAGGIGITPIMPMIAEVSDRKTPWNLVYGGRSLPSMAFASELRDYGHTVSIRPEDEYGRLDLTALLADAEPGAAVFCCGPETLIEAIEHLAAERHDISLHTERFRPRELATTTTDRAFEVVLARSDMTIHVGPEHSIADALEAVGVDVLTSCREGVCGTCETEVIDGSIEHRDSYLDTQERSCGTSIMICCSRAGGDRLVLDL